MMADVNSDFERRSPELRVLFVNGTVLKVEKHDILAWLVDRTTVGLVAVASAIFLIYYAYFSKSQYLPKEDWQVAAVVCACVVAMFALILAMVYLSFLIVRVQPKFILPIPLLVVVAHVIIQLVSVAFVKHWDVYVPDYTLLYERIIVLYCLILLFEIIYSAYVLPLTKVYKDNLHVQLSDIVTKDLPAEPETTHQDDHVTSRKINVGAEPNHAEMRSRPAKTLKLGDREIECGKIRMIKAEQNYIRVETEADSILIRAKMNETVDAIGSAFGVQAHRSCWLSYGMIAGTKKISNGRLALKLSNGEVIEVPRARRKLVLSAMDRADHAQA